MGTLHRPDAALMQHGFLPPPTLAPLLLAHDHGGAAGSALRKGGEYAPSPPTDSDYGV